MGGRDGAWVRQTGQKKQTLDDQKRKSTPRAYSQERTNSLTIILIEKNKRDSSDGSTAKVCRKGRETRCENRKDVRAFTGLGGHPERAEQEESLFKIIIASVPV